MAARDGLFVAGPGGVGQTSPTEARLALGGLMAAGSGGAAVRAGAEYGPAVFNVVGKTNMSYDVSGGQAVITRGTSVGPYLCSIDGTTNVTTTAAPGSGSRYDVIYLLQPDAGEGDTDSVATLGVVQGSAGGSPAVPIGDVPVGALAIAQALIPSGTTRTDTGVTITKVVPYTSARGAPIPVRNGTERDALTKYAGLVARRLDTGLDEITDGSTWALFGALSFAAQTAPLTVKSGSNVSTTSGAGQVSINTGLSSLLVVMLTNGDGGAQPFGIVSRVGSFSGGSFIAKWTDGDVGAAIGGESVRTDWLAIGFA